jgi:hypothetical protein
MTAAVNRKASLLC